MSNFVLMTRGLLIALVMLAGAPAMAAWELDGERSTVQFMSIKNSSIAELHFFKSISGGISESGNAEIAIDLDSVETLIPIRNQRMRELFFETVRFPAATLTAEVPAELMATEPGESVQAALDVRVDLHGTVVPYTIKVLVTRLVDGALQVVISDPVVISVADFALGAGVEMLREIAGLNSISTAIPVSGQLVFTTLTPTP